MTATAAPARVVIVRILLWSLFDSKTKIDEL